MALLPIFRLSMSIVPKPQILRFTSSLIRPSLFGQTTLVPPSLHTLVTYRPFSLSSNDLPPNGPPINNQNPVKTPDDSNPPKDPPPPKNADQSSVVSPAEILHFKQFVDNNPKVVSYFRNACWTYALYKTGTAVVKDVSEIYDFGSIMVEDGFPLTFDAVVKLFKGKSTQTVEEGVSVLKAEMNEGFRSLRSEVSYLKTDVSNLRTDMGDMGQKIAKELIAGSRESQVLLIILPRKE